MEDGQEIIWQDNISNVANYHSPINKLQFVQSIKMVNIYPKVKESLEKSEYLIISPWDLYTSTVCNLIIWSVKKLIKKSKAKIIYIANTTNKWWENKWLGIMDFVYVIEKYLWKKIDYLVVNNEKLLLSKEEELRLKTNISVKWGSYIFLDFLDKKKLEARGTKVIESKLLDRKSLYKHNSIKLAQIMLNIINKNYI